MHQRFVCGGARCPAGVGQHRHIACRRRRRASLAKRVHRTAPLAGQGRPFLEGSATGAGEEGLAASGQQGASRRPNAPGRPHGLGRPSQMSLADHMPWGSSAAAGWPKWAHGRIKAMSGKQRRHKDADVCVGGRMHGMGREGTRPREREKT
eukprot:351646-Chlamydomonas_euryale.AAC.1